MAAADIETGDAPRPVTGHSDRLASLRPDSDRILTLHSIWNLDTHADDGQIAMSPVDVQAVSGDLRRAVAALGEHKESDEAEQDALRQAFINFSRLIRTHTFTPDQLRRLRQELLALGRTLHERCAHLWDESVGQAFGDCLNLLQPVEKLSVLEQPPQGAAYRLGDARASVLAQFQLRFDDDLVIGPAPEDVPLWKACFNRPLASRFNAGRRCEHIGLWATLGVVAIVVMIALSILSSSYVVTQCFTVLAGVLLHEAFIRALDTIRDPRGDLANIYTSLQGAVFQIVWVLIVGLIVRGDRTYVGMWPVVCDDFGLRCSLLCDMVTRIMHRTGGTCQCSVLAKFLSPWRLLSGAG